MLTLLICVSWFLCCCCSVAFIVNIAYKHHDFEPQISYFIPVVGSRKTQLSSKISSLRSLFGISKWASEGYDKYSKSNKPFAIPTPDFGPMIVLPRSQFKLYGQPESTLEMRTTAEAIIQFNYTCPDKQVRDTRLEINVIRKQLTRGINNITTRVADELTLGFQRTWGYSKKWKTFNVWDAARKIIVGAANSAIVGEDLCRDTALLELVDSHTMSTFTGAFIISILPTSFQPMVGWAVAKIVNHQSNQAMSRAMPVILDRLDKSAKLKTDPLYDWTPPQDCLQWVIEESHASPLPDELRADRVWHRLLIINNVSLLTTSYTIQNTILDLFSSNPAHGYVETLRDEAKQALKSTEGIWTADTVNRLPLMDSAIRESMRASPLGPLMLARTVTHPDGITFEDSGMKADYRTLLTVPLEAVHLDEDIYPNARQYFPFRFAASSDTKQKLLVSLDDSFLSFGTGRWACPGRFFASMEMKIFMAKLLLDYDVEYIQQRPRPWSISWMNLAPWAKIRVKCRVGEDETQ